MADHGQPVLEKAIRDQIGKLVRDLDLNPNALAPEHLEWIISYLELPDEMEAGSSQPIRRALEQALRLRRSEHQQRSRHHLDAAVPNEDPGAPGAPVEIARRPHPVRVWLSPRPHRRPGGAQPGRRPDLGY